MKKIIIILIIITINLYGYKRVITFEFNKDGMLDFKYYINFGENGFFFKRDGNSFKAPYHKYNDINYRYIPGYEPDRFVSFFEALDSGGVNTTTINLKTGLTWHSRHTKSKSQHETYISKDNLTFLRKVFLDLLE